MAAACRLFRPAAITHRDIATLASLIASRLALTGPMDAFAHRRRGAGPLVGGGELFGLTLRREHPLPFGRGVVLPLPDEALLMSLEVGDALSDLVAL